MDFSVFPAKVDAPLNQWEIEFFDGTLESSITNSKNLALFDSAVSSIDTDCLNLLIEPDASNANALRLSLLCLLAKSTRAQLRLGPQHSTISYILTDQKNINETQCLINE